jgi:hypothetical protein
MCFNPIKGLFATVDTPAVVVGKSSAIVENYRVLVGKVMEQVIDNRLGSCCTHQSPNPLGCMYSYLMRPGLSTQWHSLSMAMVRKLEESADISVLPMFRRLFRTGQSLVCKTKII